MKNHLQNCLTVWKDSRQAQMHHEGAEHLGPAALYRMALPKGMKNAGSQALNHLSLCPECLAQWANWRRAITDIEELESFKGQPDSTMTFGMLRAAADPSSTKPISLKSPCGKFVLCVLPRPENPEQGMVTLDVLADDPRALDGKQATVRDKTGLIIARATFQGGRFARRIDRISELDLSLWTVIVES